ncbi:hypothetical protein [Sphingobacterium hotanense]|uniref:hypothetical protein n=1 Tax=Sphingobacterium hotanense TaxID=649196 RepID=UPI0035CCCF96
MWQIRQHRQKKLLESERIALDNHYASNQSFFWDLLIMLETIPVLLFNIFKRI